MTLLDLLPFCIHPRRHGTKPKPKKKGKVSPKRKMRYHRDRLWRKDPHCYYCQRKIGEGRGTADHVVPRSRKGRNLSQNIVLACALCNEAKRDMTLKEWAIRITRAYFRSLREGRPA